MRELFRVKVSDIAGISGEPIPESDLVVTRAQPFRTSMGTLFYS